MPSTDTIRVHVPLTLRIRAGGPAGSRPRSPRDRSVHDQLLDAAWRVATVPDDKYDSYAPHTVMLVMKGADAVKIRRHIEHCCTVNMGLGSRQDTDEALKSFVDELLKLQKP